MECGSKDEWSGSREVALLGRVLARNVRFWDSLGNWVDDGVEDSRAEREELNEVGMDFGTFKSNSSSLWFTNLLSFSFDS